MWWQVIPPLAIMGGCVGVMYASQGFTRYVFYGAPMHRQLSECTNYDPYQRIAYKRDNYIVGNRRDHQGFEALSDED